MHSACSSVLVLLWFLLNFIIYRTTNKSIKQKPRIVDRFIVTEQKETVLNDADFEINQSLKEQTEMIHKSNNIFNVKPHLTLSFDSTSINEVNF